MCVRLKPWVAAGSEASFRDENHAVTVPHPSIAVNGITTMRLHRLHFSSRPCPRTFAMSCPHSQRVSLSWQIEELLRTIIRAEFCVDEIENDY